MTEVVPIGPADAPWLAALHAMAFPGEPWSADAFAALLGQPGVGGAAARAAGEPLGLILWRQAVDEAEILTVGVHPDGRRRGLGGALVDRALAILAPDVRSLFLEVAADNAAARALYEAKGFRPVGRRRGYYRRPDGAIDAIVLRRLPTPAG